MRIMPSGLCNAMIGLGLLMMSVSANAELAFIEDASGRQSAAHRDLTQWTHSRLVFNRDLKRVAVGQEKTLEVEVLNGREVLLLAKSVGRTSLIVWYTDGSSETFLFSVSEDLSVLRSALRDIHPAIRLELAPDRPALVLRGRVPTVDFKLAAEAAARHYLGAGTASPANPASHDTTLDGNPLHILKTAQNALGSAFRLNPQNVSAPSRVAVINLIQVAQLPSTIEQKIAAAIKPMGGDKVRIRRVIHGEIANDQKDTLILEGEVRDQVALTRILSVASKLFVKDGPGQSGGGATIAMTDESGGLIGARRNGPSASGLPGSFTSSSGGLNGNSIRTNVARSKLLSIADGRLLSIIRVRDLPQVRVSVQIHEINRIRMYRWRPDFSLVTNGYASEGLFSLGGLSAKPADSSMIENALQVLGGTLTNNLQIGGSDAAFDLLFSLMEQEGIARTLSRPTLTVLAGESAVFSVGGEVPIPTAFAPSGLKSGDQVGSNAPGVFSGTSFKSFGVELSVRAMVDEDDRITLDVNPTISAPDTLLTQQISQSTGNSLNSTAFNSRSIRTTTRLKDGQPLVLGGLVYREQSSQQTHTPSVHNIPIFGRLAEAFSDSEQDRELVIVVTPTLVREPDGQVHQWAFPSTLDLADQALLAMRRHDSQEN